MLMNSTIRLVCLYCSLAALLCLSAPAPPAHAQFIKWSADKKVQLNIVRPPEFGLTVRRVAFGQPSGQCSNELVDRMIMPEFQQNQIDVIERQQLDQILAEHNFGQSVYADAASSSKLGRILGPSALILVNVYSCSPEQKSLYQDEQAFGGGVHRVFISRTRFNLEGALKIVDLTTGRVLGSHNFESKPEQQNTADNGQPEFPDADVLKDQAMQEVKAQISAMFFLSADTKNLLFYDDKDCGLKEVYELMHRGDASGALSLSLSNLEACKSGAKKDKTLARAYYDAGLLSCIRGDYVRAKDLFNQAMQSKGADAVAETSSDCNAAQSGAASVKSYLARVAQIPAPTPLESAPASASSTGSSSGPQKIANANPPSSPIAGGDPPSGAGPLSVEDRLKKLDELLKKGLITRKDYDAKKAEILKDL